MTPFTTPQLDPLAKKILNENTFLVVTANVQGTAAATAGNYGNFFVADTSYKVMAITQVHRVAGSDAGAVTLDVEKCTSGTAPNSGVTLLQTALSLKATANTPQFGTLTVTKANLLLSKGDRLVLKDTGTLTACEDVSVTIILKRY